MLGNQVISIVAVMAYSFVVSWLIAKALDLTIGLRVSDEAELTGLDQTEHAETAYMFTSSGANRIN